MHYIAFDYGRRRYYFTYLDWWPPRSMRVEYKQRRKSWPEADYEKAQKWVAAYWEKFFRLKDADCLNCGEAHAFPSELCVPCDSAAVFWARARKRKDHSYITERLMPVREEFIAEVVL